jgi:hypothetical protein
MGLRPGLRPTDDDENQHFISDILATVEERERS